MEKMDFREEEHRKKHKDSKYESMMARCSEQAEVTGRREPYYMTYTRKFGDALPVPPKNVNTKGVNTKNVNTKRQGRRRK